MKITFITQEYNTQTFMYLFNLTIKNKTRQSFQICPSNKRKDTDMRLKII